MQISIKKDIEFMDQFNQNIHELNDLATWELFLKSYQIAETLKVHSFDTLISLNFLPQMTFLPHQLACAEDVVQSMNGRALLADEVGLGKTIEAGLILKEYLVRGLVQKVLILAPASLVNQWAVELNSKFYIPAITAGKRVDWENSNILITTLDLAKREPHRSVILNQTYDMVIVDEAHKLKNHQTKNYQFIQELQKKYFLLLTATPVQNKLTDLFNLINLLKPGYLGTYEDFQRKYRDKKIKVESDVYLKQLISKVMIRNRRTDSGVEWTERKVETIWVDFTSEELDTYREVENVCKQLNIPTSIMFKREFCSSREACYVSLKKWASLKPEETNISCLEDLFVQIESLPHHAKAVKLLELLKSNDEKFIVFTEYRATQLYLQWLLHQNDIPAVIYRGGFKKGKRDWMRQLFHDKARVMIATEAAGEGINLQFCHHLINYDLPWNPMRLEQRIGRIHRYGQAHDVKIYNFAIKQTMEEHVMELLYNKISLFENVIGQLDQILQELHIDNLEKELQQIFTESKSNGETMVKINNLAAVIHSMSNTEIGESG
ncbi:DEAD/DEAH box helicase [Gracilibacillus marinus]|jgi:SNF2 family DNA or RNA helicase|uniref:DEAD/DEAH box helicase n=1 Tax=Gracilibacillus marinus TaxID=630535 RepID=A0ABV8VXW3_9BACI